MTATSAKAGRWLDIVMLSAAALMLAPIVLVALAPVLLTFMVLWPLLILPVVAAPRLAPTPKPQKPQRTIWFLRGPRHLPQPA